MQADSNDKVWVVIAAFNEESVIATTIEGVQKYFKNVVVCDDCSSDDTKGQAFTAGAHVLVHPVNLGQGAALQTGISYSLKQGAEYIVTFDADGQHSANEIICMLSALKENHVDVVLGSRFLNNKSNIPLLRKIILRAALLYTRLTTKIKLTDVHNGFRVLSRSFCEKFEFKQNRMAHASEILDYISSNKISYVEYPVTIAYTEYSLQKGQRNSNTIRILLELLMGRISK